MKVFIHLVISEHFSDGLYLSVTDANMRKMYETKEHCIVTEDFDIDLTPHMAWIVKQSQEVAENLTIKAKNEFDYRMSKVKEFESKFLLLTHPVVTEERSDAETWQEAASGSASSVEDESSFIGDGSGGGCTEGSTDRQD